jgi:hypothetical protein
VTVIIEDRCVIGERQSLEREDRQELDSRRRLRRDIDVPPDYVMGIPAGLQFSLE